MKLPCLLGTNDCLQLLSLSSSRFTGSLPPDLCLGDKLWDNWLPSALPSSIDSSPGQTLSGPSIPTKTEEEIRTEKDSARSRLLPRDRPIPYSLSSLSLKQGSKTAPMLTRVNGVGWMEEGGGVGDDNEEGASWLRSNPGASETKDEVGLTDFKSLLDDDWYIGGATATDPGTSTHEGFDALPTHYDLKVVSFSSNTSPAEALLLPPADANFSCSPSSVFHLNPAQPFFLPKSVLPSLLSSVCSNTFDTAFDLGSDVPGLLPVSSSPVMVNRGSAGGVLGFAGTGPGEQMGSPDLIWGAQFPGAARILPPPPKNCPDSIFRTASNPFESFENSPFLKGSNVLRPLEIFPPMGAQRKVALLQNSAVAGENGGILGFLGSGGGQGSCGRSAMEEENDKNRKGNEEDEIDESSIGGSGLNYDTDDASGENAKGDGNAKSGGGGGGSNSNANSMVTGVGDEKVKKKGMPAKNLMAERRRRKKLNDRLYMLRSVVPKISKVNLLMAFG